MLREIAGLGFGWVELSHGIKITLVPGILLIPRYRLPVVDRSSLQLVASPALAIGEHVHPEDGPVLILVWALTAPVVISFMHTRW